MSTTPATYVIAVPCNNEAHSSTHRHISTTPTV